MSDVLEASAPGVRITATPRGAHLLTWTTDGVDRLWMSPLSGPDAPGAIRGGIPVLFPQFGTFGSLVKHGFARTAEWTPVTAPEVPEAATLAFELTDSEETRALWPHAFHARIDITATSTHLEEVLRVTNLSNEHALFTGGLHAYLAVADSEAWIDGLNGTHVWDGESTEAPKFPTMLGPKVRALDEQDLIIRGAVGPVTLVDEQLGRLHVAGDGFAHRIVWNPGQNHGLPDVEPEGASQFVCIETAAVTPIHLAAGSTWEGSERLTVA